MAESTPGAARRRRSTARPKRADPTPSAPPGPPADAAPAPPADAAPPAERVADDAAVEALLDLLTGGVAALPDALAQGEEARRARADATRELFGSREFATATRQQPDLRKKVQLVGDELSRQDAEAESSRAELGAAVDGWLAALEQLRG